MRTASVDRPEQSVFVSDDIAVVHVSLGRSTRFLATGQSPRLGRTCSHTGAGRRRFGLLHDRQRLAAGAEWTLSERRTRGETMSN